MTKDSLSKLLFWTVIVILISVSLLTYRNLNDYTSEVKSVRHSARVLRTLEIVLSGLKDAEIGQRGFQLTRDTTFLDPYYLSIQTLTSQLHILDSLLSDNPEASKKVDTLRQLAQTQFDIIARIVLNAKKSSLFMDQYENSMIMDAKLNMDKLRGVASRIRTSEERLFRKRELSETDLRNIAPVYLLVYGLVPMMGLVFLFTRLLEGLERRRKTEKQLKENIVEVRKQAAMREFTQKTLRKILDNSPNGIMAFRSIRNNKNEIEDFKWVLANTLSVTAWGLDEKELIGKRLLATMGGEIKPGGLFQCYREVVETGVSFQGEHRHINRGSDQWWYITVVKFEDGCIVTFSDITQKKLQQSLLEEHALLLGEAEGLASMGSWKWTEKDNLIWSDGLYKVLKKAKDIQPSWKSFLDNVHPDDTGLVSEFISTVMDRQDPAKLNYRVLLENQVHHLSMSMTPMWSDGDSYHLLGVVIDITDMKVYENQLKQYTSELQRSNEDLEQFAYIASHDLQEPLRKIRAFGERLSTKFHNVLDATGQDYIMRMESAATRMQALIEDILAFSKVSRSIGAYENLNVRRLIDEVVDDLGAQLKRERGTVRIGSIPNIRGDRAQIKRLFQNLVSNGLKFHKAHERPIVEINGQVVKGTQVWEQFGKPATGDYVTISVKDNGIGFDEKYKEKIFNIFQRLHGRTEYEGTGIGLSICRKIVANHGGAIFTKSKENVGSEFIVILPIEQY